MTERLHGKLDESDLREVESRLTPDECEVRNKAQPLERKRLTLAFGVHYGVPGVIAKTGLSRAAPPPEIHAMGRGAPAAGGSYYYADLVIEALRRAGAEPRPAARALDFGCSSGRVVRLLAAAYPRMAWYGCDPNESSINWARAHLEGVEFAVSPQDPPLRHPDEFFDFVFAVSIWSHFAEGAALRWLAEMRRVIKPGGHLVLTTHGQDSIAHYARNRLASQGQLAEVLEGLYTHGFGFTPFFGQRGDHGIVNPEWGMACLSAEWLSAHVCPQWSVAYFALGWVEDNQDLYVLERR